MYLQVAETELSVLSFAPYNYVMVLCGEDEGMGDEWEGGNGREVDGGGGRNVTDLLII